MDHELKVELLKRSRQVHDLYQRTQYQRLNASTSSSCFRLFKRKASNTVVLVGLGNSGKTTLFRQLRDGSINQGTTVPSVEPIADTFVLFSERSEKGKIKPVHVVDVPGHMYSKLDEFLNEASAVVFVVDATGGNVWLASRYLYELLTNECVLKKKIPVLILCNKVDLINVNPLSSLSHPIKHLVGTMLESRIDLLRLERKEASKPKLGEAGKRFFHFSQCHNRVTLGVSSGLIGEISELEAFIREHVKP